ncbi:MAG: hypothetical protein LBI33_01025 [Propionibacteriaceae bacterium]|jgi:hypothetical protein|nr:hypothetical protein [Propionibacteriaceae bacterium]
MGHIQHFLLIYDHKQGRLVDTHAYGADSATALKEYAAFEAQFRDDPTMDIVLVGSDSLDTIKVTHKNYFDNAKSMAEWADYLSHVFVDSEDLLPV